MKYIHYGADKFDRNKFLRIVNQDHDWTKPKQGGIWASSIDAKFGWKQWCESEDFYTERLQKSFQFCLLSNAKVCHIRNYKDLYKLPELSNKILDIPIKSIYYRIDFEKASKVYDAIELHLSEDIYTDYQNSLYFKLYAWDCDSILIMNPDIIIC